MSFVKLLATLAAGFAAAKGFDKFRKAGGMAGMQDQMRKAGEPGGMSDQLGQMAEKMGVPGGAKAVKDMFATWGPKAAEATEAAEVGLGGLMTTMQGAMAAGAERMGDMMSAITGATPASAVIEENARLMIRAMIEAAKADGQIDPEERARIMAHLENASDEERAFVTRQMDAPSDLAGLAAAATDTTRAQVYSTALLIMTADTDAEKTWLDQLAAALGLDADTRARIHAGMGRAGQA